MMSEAYYRKWRPLDWGSVIGQDHVTQTLQNAIIQDRIAHAFLFSGPRGTGKTSTARIIAKAVNCIGEDSAGKPCNACENCNAINAGRFLDLIEIDAASNTSVDDVRSLREKINFSPSMGNFKVYIIDEVHMLSNAAFNALLKTLEEPPNHAIFVLATTEVNKIPATVLSRCQRHEFRRIPVNSIQVNLKHIAEEEGISIEPNALTEIARQATGSMRDAVSLLDQLASTGKKITLDFTKEVLGTAGNDAVVSLTKAIIEKDPGVAISIVNQALDQGTDPRQFGRQIVDYLRDVLLVKLGNENSLDTSKEEHAQLSDFARQFDNYKLVKAIEVFDRSSQSTSLGWQPSLQLELAVMQICKEELPPAEAPIARNPKGKNVATNPKKPDRAKQSENTTKSRQPTSSGMKPEQAASEIKKQSAPPPGDVDIEKNGIQVYWTEIKETAKSISPETAALLNSCKSVQASEDTITLQFSSSILQSKMEHGNNIENAKLAVNRYSGKDYKIRCEVAGKKNDSSSIDPGVDQDGMVGAALSLGGKMTKEE